MRKKIFSLLAIMAVLFSLLGCSHTVPIVLVTEIQCEWNQEFGALSETGDGLYIGPNVFSKLDQLQLPAYMRECEEIIEYAKSFDFEKAMLVVSLGYKLKSVFTTSYKFRGKLLPQFKVYSTLHADTAFLYSIAPNSVQDAMYGVPFPVRVVK